MTEQSIDVACFGRTPTRVIRVDAEPGDEVSQAGHSHILIAVRRSIADLRASGPHYEYALFLPGDDFPSDDPSFVASVPGSEDAPAEALGLAIVTDWKRRFRP